MRRKHDVSGRFFKKRHLKKCQRTSRLRNLVMESLEDRCLLTCDLLSHIEPIDDSVLVIGKGTTDDGGVTTDCMESVHVTYSSDVCRIQVGASNGIVTDATLGAYGSISTSIRGGDLHGGDMCVTVDVNSGMNSFSQLASLASEDEVSDGTCSDTMLELATPNDIWDADGNGIRSTFVCDLQTNIIMRDRLPLSGGTVFNVSIADSTVRSSRLCMSHVTAGIEAAHNYTETYIDNSGLVVICAIFVGCVPLSAFNAAVYRRANSSGHKRKAALKATKQAIQEMGPEEYERAVAEADNFIESAIVARTIHTEQESGEELAQFDWGTLEMDLIRANHFRDGAGVSVVPGVLVVVACNVDQDVASAEFVFVNRNSDATNGGNRIANEIAYDESVGVEPEMDGQNHTVTLHPGASIDHLDFGNHQVVTTGEIHGVEWHDFNGDGQRDPNEPAIPRWTIFIDDNGDGILNKGGLAGETMADDTGTPDGETGMFWFTDLPTEVYRVAVVVPFGWERTLPGGDGSHVVDLTAGGVVEDVDFGNRHAWGAIDGSKLLDADGDGLRGEIEVGLVDWTITLSSVDAQGNPVNRTTNTMPTDPNTPIVDETGTCWFDELSVGFYTVGEVIPGEDWVQKFPGGVREEISFGNMQQAQARSIHGQKFEVNNGDGGDHFDFRDSLVPIVFFGGDGDDEVCGSPFNDIFCVGGGSDFVRGGDSGDDIYAITGAGNVLHAGEGDDCLKGIGNSDFLNGGAGADSFVLHGRDIAQDATEEDHVRLQNDRVEERRRNRINCRHQAQQNEVVPQAVPVKVSADATSEITHFTINQNAATEGEGVVFTVRAAADNWARLELFVDENNDGQLESNVDTLLGRFRDRNRDWRGQIGTAKLDPGKHAIRARLLPLSGNIALSNPISLEVQKEVVLLEPPQLPDSLEINPDDVLILVPHEDGDVNADGNTLFGEGQIDHWELTPRSVVQRGGLRIRTEGPTSTVVALYDVNGNLLTGPDEDGDITVMLDAARTYYFAVTGLHGAAGDYNVRMTGTNQTHTSDIVVTAPTYEGYASASFGAGYRLDFFEVSSPSEATILDVNVDDDPGLDVWVRVADDNNNVVGFAHLGQPSAPPILENLPVDPSTRYYVTTYALYATEGNYTVNVEFYPDELGFDDNLSRSPTAMSLVLNQDGERQQEGLSTGDASEIDYYLLTPPTSGSAGTVEYVLSTLGNFDTQIGVYLRSGDASSSLIAESGDGGQGLTAKLTVELEKGDGYILAVRSDNQETGSYSLTLSLPPRSIATLTPTGLESTTSGGRSFISNNNRYHVHKTSVPTYSDRVTAFVEYIDRDRPDRILDSSLYVWDQRGQLLTYVNIAGTESNGSLPDFPVTPGTKIYFTVYGEDPTIGHYELSVDFERNLPVDTGIEFPVSDGDSGNPIDEWPDVDRNANGQGVIVWRAGQVLDGAFAHDEIRGLRIGADGQPETSTFRIDQGTEDDFGKPAVAAAPDGSFVVVWDDKVRCFSSSGSPLSSETIFTSQSPTSVAIATKADGCFAVVWNATDTPGDPEGAIYARQVNSSGVPTGPEIHVNTHTDEHQEDPDVAILSNGDWIVAWFSNVADSGYDIDFRGRIFQGSSPVTDEFAVNTNTSGHQFSPAISASQYGNGYVIVWMNSSSTVSFRQYANDHSSTGDEFQATITPDGSGVYDEPDVAMEGDGRFIVAAVVSDDDGKGVVVRQFRPDGVPVGTEFVLNQIETNDQDTPTIVGDGNGKYLSAWRSKGGLTDIPDIRGLEFALQAVQEPELTILDTKEDSADLSIDFGTLEYESPQSVYQLTIRNDGNSGLEIQNLTLTGPSTHFFAVDELTDFALAPNSTKTVQVKLNAVEVGSADATLVFEHDDTLEVASVDVDENSVSIARAADVILPPTLSATIVDQGETWVPLDVAGNGGNFQLGGSTLTVTLGTSTTGYVIADAVRIEKLPMLLAADEVASLEPTLDAAAVADAVTAVAAEWSHVDRSVAARLSNVTVQIANLPGDVLGLASESTGRIWLDADAVGHGWNLRQKSRDKSQGRAVASSLNPHSAFRTPRLVDLLSVVTHELGHLLDLPNLDALERPHEVIASRLKMGLRRLALGVRALTNEALPVFRSSASASDRLFADFDQLPVVIRHNGLHQAVVHDHDERSSMFDALERHIANSNLAAGSVKDYEYELWEYTPDRREGMDEEESVDRLFAEWLDVF